MVHHCLFVFAHIVIYIYTLGNSRHGIWFYRENAEKAEVYKVGGNLPQEVYKVVLQPPPGCLYKVVLQPFFDTPETYKKANIQEVTPPLNTRVKAG